VGLLRGSLAAIRHRLLRGRQLRARRAAQYEQAYALLLRELYTDFSRPMAEIHLDMAWERLAAGKLDEATTLLKLADEDRLGTAARCEKRLLGAWALIEQGKPAEAETRLRALEGEALDNAQARRRDELLVEACLARKDLEAARERAGAPELSPWRLVAEAELDAQKGDRAAAQALLAQAREQLGARADAPWLRRRMDRLLREKR